MSGQLYQISSSLLLLTNNFKLLVAICLGFETAEARLPPSGVCTIHRKKKRSLHLSEDFCYFYSSFTQKQKMANPAQMFGTLPACEVFPRVHVVAAHYHT